MAAAPRVPAAPAVAGPTAPRSNGFAIASLVCSLVIFIPLLPQVLAVVFGTIALTRNRPDGRRPGMAVAGLILGLAVGIGWALVLRVALLAPVGPAGLPYTAGGAWQADPDESSDHLRSALERVGAAIRAYQRDMERWPADMAELAPTYLSDRLLEQIDPDRAPTTRCLITLLPDVDPLNDPPDKIVAHSVRVDYDEYGDKLPHPQRWVLQLNGEVLRKPAEAVDDDLKARGQLQAEDESACSGISAGLATMLS